MAHAVSAFSIRSDHMSPVAALLAAVLHAATAAALFWVTPIHGPDVEDNAIEVTIEPPKPPEAPPEPPPAEPPKPQPPPAKPPTPAAQPAPPPPPPPAAAATPRPEPKPEPKPETKPETKPQPKPTSTEQLGLPPQAPTQPEEKKAEAKLEPKPEPQPEPKPEPPPPQEAAAQPIEPTPPPEPPLEKVLPPVESPTAPLSMRDFVKVLPPPPAPPVTRPAPSQQQPQPQPSPLSRTPSPQPQREASAAPSVSSFQNPADVYARNRVAESYIVGIARRIQQRPYRPPSISGLSLQGVVVLSLVVARDGRLLNASVAQSSGNPPMDEAVLDTALKAAPYGPLPPEIPGNSAPFMLRVPFNFTRQ